MRNLLQFLVFLLPFWASAQNSSTDCYKLRFDGSGNTDTSGIDLIKQNSCNLRDQLPTNEQSKFQVQDLGFYMMTEFLKSTSGNPYLDQFEEVRTKIAQEKEYYVVIGRQTDSKGIYTKFYIDVKLPNVTPNNCPDNFNVLAKNFLINKIEEEYNNRGRNYSYANQAVSKGIGALADYIQDIKQCCETQPSSVEKCLNCKSPDNMITALKSDGFVSHAIQNIGNYPIGNIPDIPEVADYAKKLFTINDLNVVDVPNSYKETIDTFKTKGLTLKVIITKDENYCTPLWDSLVIIANSGQYDIVYWHHVHKGKSIGNDLLLTKTFLRSGTGNKSDSERAVFLPLIPILKGLGSAVADAFVQAAIIYIIDDDVKTFSDAFGKVNYWQSGWSGVVGAFGINKNVALVGSAIASATGTVVYNAYNKQGYGVEEGTRDFVQNFFSAYYFKKRSVIQVV